MNAVWSDYLKAAPAINSVFLVAVLGVLIRAWLNNRKLGLESRKMTLDDNKGLRAEFIDEMHALRDEVKGLREENESLRKEVRELHGIIDGMRRDALGASVSAQRTVIDRLGGDAISGPMKRALDTLDGIKGVGE